MKKSFWAVCAAVVAIGAFVVPSSAKADTDVYVNFGGHSRQDRQHDRRHESRHSRDRHHQRVSYEPWPSHHRHWRPAPAYYIAPSYYLPPPRPVVYQTTVVRPQTYVVSGMAADQASPTYSDSYGRMCREYTTTSWVGGTPQNVYGTACLMPDGSWRTIN